jgi:hypothetical protein
MHPGLQAGGRQFDPDLCLASLTGPGSPGPFLFRTMPEQRRRFNKKIQDVSLNKFRIFSNRLGDNDSSFPILKAHILRQAGINQLEFVADLGVQPRIINRQTPPSLATKLATFIFQRALWTRCVASMRDMSACFCITASIRTADRTGPHRRPSMISSRSPDRRNLSSGCLRGTGGRPAPLASNSASTWSSPVSLPRMICARSCNNADVMVLSCIAAG